MTDYHHQGVEAALRLLRMPGAVPPMPVVYGKRKPNIRAMPRFCKVVPSAPGVIAP